MKQFISPQTGSVYTVPNQDPETFVSYRELEDGTFRVRIQSSDPDLLERISIRFGWSYGATGTDHLSKTIPRKELPGVLGEAVYALEWALGNIF